MNHLAQNIAYLKESVDGFPPLDGNSSWNEIEEAVSKAGYDLETVLQFNLDATKLPWDDIKFVLLDVDGVMTEGGMFYTDSGDEFKRFDTKDGMAIKKGMAVEIGFGIISSGVNTKIISHRAQMFGIDHVYVGKEAKIQIAEQWLSKLGLNWNEVGYIGDDVNDLELFSKVGICAAPADATIPVKENASFILQSKGGHGCIREFMRYHPQLAGAL